MYISFCVFFQGWLVDLINRFGSLNGFQILLDRFQNGPALNVPVIAALIKPFGLCYELLTPNTVQKYFAPIIVSNFLSDFSEFLKNTELQHVQLMLLLLEHLVGKDVK